MSSELKIDDKGAREMFAALQRKTGMTYRDVVRGISAEVLTSAAQRTKATTLQKVKESVEKELRKPMNVNGDLIGRTKSGKVWYAGKTWSRARRNFILLDAGGRPHTNIKKAGKTVPGVVLGRRAAKGVRVSGKLQGEINQAVQAANERRKRNLQRIKEKIGSGQAAWLEIMRQLSLKPTSSAKLSKGLKAKMHPNNRAAVAGFEDGQGDEFAVVVTNKSRSSLGPKSGDGLNAFRWALSGKIKQFQNAAKKDLETYARRFAQRHGFDVS